MEAAPPPAMALQALQRHGERRWCPRSSVCAAGGAPAAPGADSFTRCAGDGAGWEARGKARKAEAAATVHNDPHSSAALGSASSAASDVRQPCTHNLLLGGRERIALMDVTTAVVTACNAAAGVPAAAALAMARTPVDVKIDI